MLKKTISIYKEHVTILSILALFIILASVRIFSPGFYYDELLFLNASYFGKSSDLFIHQKMFGIPVMVMPYVGAIKSLIYAPIVNIFEVNEFTIRFPSILIVGFSLLVNYLTVKLLFNKKTAIIFLLLTSIDVSLIHHAKLDWGPTSLMLLFRNLSIYFYYKYALSTELKNSKYFVLFFISLTLGILDKFNFIWIAISIIITILIFNSDKIKNINIFQIFKSNKLLTIFFITIATLLLIIYFKNIPYLLNFDNSFTYIKNGEPVTISTFLGSFSQRLDEIKNLLYFIFTGSDVFIFVTGKEIPLISKIYFLIFLLVFFISNIYVFFFSEKKLVFYWLYTFIIILLLFNFFTKMASGSHHFMVFSSLLYLPIAYFLSELNTKWLLKIFCIFLLLISLSNLFILENIWNKETNNVWDKNTKNVSTYLYEMNPEKIICIDWGICTIIQAYLNDRIQTIDFWPWFNRQLTEEELNWFKNEFIKKDVAFIGHLEKSVVFKSTLDNYNNLNDAWGLERIKIFNNQNNEEFIFIDVLK